MQKQKTTATWRLISNFFFTTKRKSEIGVLLIVILGLFSNFAFAQNPLPLENFNSGLPASWAVTGTQTFTNNWTPTTATGGYQSTPGLMVNPALNNTQGTTAKYFLITPQITTVAQTEIRFFTKQGSYTNKGTIYELRLSTAAQPDLNSFNSILLQSWTETQINTNPLAYEEKIVTVALPAGVPVYIAFVAVTNQDAANLSSTSGDTWFVDNIRIINSCSPVTGINATMSANGGIINWTHPFATNFEVQVVPSGSGILTTGTPVSATQYTASGLSAGTAYDVYIKTICDATTASGWAGPFPVTTSSLGLTCAAPIVIPATVTSTPYVLSTNLATFHDPQNYTPLSSIGLSCQPPGQSQNWLSGDHAILSYTPTTSGLVSISQSVTISGAVNNCYNALSSVFVFDSCTGIGTTANCLGSLVTGTALGNSVQLSNIYLPGGSGQTYYFIISSPYQYNPTAAGAGLCFTFTLSAPTCPIPGNLEFQNLLDTSATVSWGNPQNLVSNWQYLVKPVANGAPNGSDVAIPSTTNTNLAVAGLLPNTKYNLYVRSVCSGTPGGWSTPLAFTTQCTTFTTPYSTQYTNSTDADPQCWYSLDLNKDGRFFTYAGAPDSPPVQGQLVRLRTMDSGSQTNDMLVSPRFNFDGVNQKQIRFKYKGFGGYNNSTGYVLGESSFSMKLSTTGVGSNNFTTDLLPIATYQTGNNYVEMIVAVPITVVGQVNIAWVLPPGYINTSTNFYVDDVYVEDLPSCSPPSYAGVVTASITQTSAQFYWTNGLNNSQWEIAVQPLNSGIPTGNGVLAGTNPFVMTNLTPATQYEYYIRAYCSATLQSVWVGPIKFNTLCNAIPIPYVESLNDTDTTTKKFCWSVDNRNGDANSNWTIEATQASIVGRNLPMNPFVSFDDYLITPQINVVGQKMLKYKYRAPTSIFSPIQRGNFEVIMSSSPSFATYTVLIPSQDFFNSNYQEESVIFTGTGPTYFAFHIPPTMTNPTNSGIMMIDDFSITDAPPCPDPSLLLANNITTTTAALSWTPGFQETQWQVAIQSPGSGVPTGSGTIVNTNPNFTASGLVENTNYEYYVRAICNPTENSPWIGPKTFQTICTPFPTPFIETFDANSTSESCWKIVNNNGDAKKWGTNSPVQPMFGDQNAAVSTSTNGANDEWLITPTLIVQPNQRLRFFYRTLFNGYEEDLKVKISSTGTDLAGFTTTLFDTGANPIVDTVVRERVINLTGITTTTNINIAFHIPTFPPNPWGYRGQFLFLDNVIVENIPACPPVINVSVTTNTITDTTAQVNWQSTGSETSWELSVQPFGTAAPTGTTLPQYLYTTSANPFTITGLIPATKYQVYVRAICGSASQSNWTTSVTFITKCDVSNACQYTISLKNGSTGQVQAGINLVQNGTVIQQLTFPVVAPNQPLVLDYSVFLCSGIEYSLYWSGIGSGLQYSQAQVVIKDQTGAIVWTSPLGLGTINTNIYTGFSSCTTITCPKPTNLTASNSGVLSWTPGGSETQWEVFIQDLGNGSIPQSGIIVNTPSYTPVATDFLYPLAGTNEFFVRAVCGPNTKSYWSGPKVFIKNDEPSTAIVLPVNAGGTCTTVGTKASFLGATASTIPSTCGTASQVDIWYQFVATSKVQTIELSNFGPGSYYGSAFEGAWPRTLMSLYEVGANGTTLTEKACSENHSIVAEYASELTIGTTYKIRIRYNGTALNDKKFDICVSAPSNLCDRNAFNYSFEKLPMQTVTGITAIQNAIVTPGWRVNTDFNTIYFQEAGNSPGVIPYHGAQCIQLTFDSPSTWNPTDVTNIKGLYKDFDTSDMFKMKYSFASASRITTPPGTTLELWAGPPSGPFTLVTQHNSSTLVWQVVTGNYTIPAGQTTTRFIFRTTNYAGSHLLDAANFVANTDIVTQDATISCNQSINIEAIGFGQWVADAGNPATTIIANANAMSTTISGFLISGVYKYHWKTKYCDKILTITYQGVNQVPTVVSPVTYCLTSTATALTATAPSGYTLVWYTVGVGGTGVATAPIPSTATVGTTTYYVALADALGCKGARIPINVVINNLITPGLTFSYNATEFCTSGTNPIITPASGFTSGGTFAASPTGLTIDGATGAINLATSSPGVYNITYTLAAVACTLGGSSNYAVKVSQPVTYDVLSQCESQIMFLNVTPTNGSNLANVNYLWQDAGGTTIGSNAPTFNVNDYLAQNSAVVLPTTIRVTASDGACTLTKTYALTTNECSLIPRGISPNNDGDNDTFDLTGLGATQVTVFNRYGLEVFSYNGTYTNQFKGNDKNGSELPDGTYFYNITLQDDKEVTGWVYVLRQQ